MNRKTRSRRVFFRRAISVLLIIAIGLMCTQSAAAYKIGDDGEPVHEEIVDRARILYSNYEINYYFEQIKHGAEHEDLHDHVFDRSGLCLWIDHFWDADNGPYDPVDVPVIICAKGVNAWQKAQILWGMALGEYATGDKETAYEYLGHVAHLLADMTVPAHAHEDAHPEGDCYEEWMTWWNAQLWYPDLDWLNSKGPLEIPDWANDPLDYKTDPLYYLFYTTNQIGDFFPSEDYDGDTIDKDEWGGWMDEIYSELGMDSIIKPRTAEDLEDNIEPDNDEDGDLSVIRKYCYLHAIRATAALYKLFYETAKQNSALTVVIDSIDALDVHDEPWGLADFYVHILIWGERVYVGTNRGNQIEDDDHISPGWAFAAYVGLSGTVDVYIQLWDDDWPWGDNEESDINPVEDMRYLALTIDLANGAISGDLTGMCGTTLTSEGTEDDCSNITFRILMPNIPPTANAGPDQTVDEGDLVSVVGSFTDPNTEDTHTAVWDWGDGSPAEPGTVVESGGAGTVTGTHVYGDNGAYTVTLNVTDDDGAKGTDTLTITVNNVAPTATIDSMAQPNPHFVLPIVHTLTFTGSFTDPGWLDTHTATWDFGDGTVVPGTLTEENVEPDATGTTTADHVYSEPGTYTVTLTITDDDGGVGTDTMEVIVASAEEAREILNEYIQSLPDEAFRNNPNQRKKALNNLFSAIEDMLADEEWKGAIEDLRNNIRGKSDGFVDGSLRDDWIIDPTAQQEICMMIDDLTAYLETFL